MNLLLNGDGERERKYAWALDDGVEVTRGEVVLVVHDDVELRDGIMYVCYVCMYAYSVHTYVHIYIHTHVHM